MTVTELKSHWGKGLIILMYVLFNTIPRNTNVYYQSFISKVVYGTLKQSYIEIPLNNYPPPLTLTGTAGGEQLYTKIHVSLTLID